METPLVAPKLDRTISWQQNLVDEMTKTRELPTAEDGELPRRLTALELTLLGIGACIGAGIFVLTGAEARIAGPSVAVSFLLAGMSSIFNGLCFAELATRLPVSGSSYLYVYCMFGELPALMLVINQLVDYHIGAATLSRSLVAYLAEALREMNVEVGDCFSGCQPFESAPWFSISYGAPLMLFLVTYIVSRGAETNAVVTSVVTVVKICVVILVIVIGWQKMQMSYLHPFFPYGFTATIQSAATLSYAFIGYDVIANAAEECENPSRDLPRAMIMALMTCAVLYVCVCLVLCGMQTFSSIDTSAPVSTTFELAGLNWVVSVVDVGSFAGMVTGLLAGIYGQSRIYFAMSRDGMAPSWLQEAPSCACWCGMLAATLATFFDVKSLASFLNIGVLLSYAMTAASVLLINSCSKKKERPLMLLAALLSGLLSMGGTWGLVGGIGMCCFLVFVQFTCGYKCGPPSTFKCPGIPLTPMVALASNVYLMCHLSHHAWLRLLVVSLLVFFLHSACVCLGILDPKKVQIWDSSQCRKLRTMTGHLGRVGTMAWNGYVLSTGSRDHHILHRDVRQPAPFMSKLHGHRQEVCGLKWSFDEQQLASGGNDNKLCIWSLKSTEPVLKFTQHQAAVKAIAWSPHQHGLLASGGGTADRHIRFWNTVNNMHLSSIDTGSQVCNLVWSKNLNEIVSTHGYSLNQIILWKYPSMTKVATLTGHTYRVLYLAISPDGQTVVTGAGDETLRFWNVFPSAKSRSSSGLSSSLPLGRTIR